MTFAEKVMLETEVKVQYLRTIFHGEELHQFDLLSSDVKDTDTPLYVDYLLKGLVWYLPL